MDISYLNPLTQLERKFYLKSNYQVHVKIHNWFKRRPFVYSRIQNLWSHFLYVLVCLFLFLWGVLCFISGCLFHLILFGWGRRGFFFLNASWKSFKNGFIFFYTFYLIIYQHCKECFPLHFHSDLSEFSGLICCCHLQQQDFLGRGAKYGTDTAANCLLKTLYAGQPNYFYFTVPLLIAAMI